MNNDYKNKKTDLTQKNFPQEITIDLLVSSLANLKLTSNNKIINSSSFNHITKLINNSLDKVFLKNSKSKKIKQLNRNMEYIYKLLNKNFSIKPKLHLINNTNFISKITILNIYLLKNNINKSNTNFIKKQISFLLLMVHFNVLPIDNFLLIIELFLSIIKKILINSNKTITDFNSFENSPIYFTQILIEEIINFPLDLKDQKISNILLNKVITKFEEYLLTIPRYILNLSKIPIWLKLLGNKIKDYTDTKFNYEKIISFLIKIYKNKLPKSYIYKMIYEPCAIDLDYFSNSLDFLNQLIKEETKDRRTNQINIKSGFYVYYNNPLIFTVENKINITENSIIFSFNISEINNNEEEIILLNFLNKEKKNIFKLFIDKKTKILKISLSKNEEINTNIDIIYNKNYFICICQKKESLFSPKQSLYLYINSYNITPQSKNNNDFYTKYKEDTNIPLFSETSTIVMGKFNGILGEVIILNTIINEKDIQYLFNICDNYTDVLCYKDTRLDFLQRIYKKLKNNEDISFFKGLKYNFHLRILTNGINQFLSHKNLINIKTVGKLHYNNNLELQEFTYSNTEDNLTREKIVEYLIYQLNNIINFSKNDTDLNFYLYKLINFFYELSTNNDNFLAIKDKKIRIDIKFSLFILSLLSNLKTKNRSFILNEKIYEIILQFYSFLKKYNNTQPLLRIFLSILSDSQIFTLTKANNIEKVFDLFIDYIESYKDSILINKDTFYKILLLDKIIEKPLNGNKKYNKILHYYLVEDVNNFIYEKDKIKAKKDLLSTRMSLIKYFLNYIVIIDNEMKYYYYLKFIYHYCDKLKENILTQFQFFEKITIYMNKIENKHCKYCNYNQILCFLLSEEIFVQSCIKNEEEKVFQYKILGFMEYPTYNFIKCVFIQFFKISNDLKFKFIKLLDIQKNEMNFFIEKANANIASLVEYSKFIPKFNAIISYLSFLYNKYKDSCNDEMITLLENSYKLIISFLDYIIENNNNNDYSENTSCESSVKGGKDNISKKSRSAQCLYCVNHNENYLSDKEEFFINLFCSEGVYNFFLIYYNLVEVKENLDFDLLNKIIGNTITKIYNPFYFEFLTNDIILNEDIEINQLIKIELLKIMTKELNNSILNKKITILIIQNHILLLIYIHKMILNINEYGYIFTDEAEEYIMSFLYSLIRNNFLYSKLMFNIIINDKDSNDFQKKTKKYQSQKNMVSGNISQNLNSSFSSKKNKSESHIYKFILEIIIDIIFSINEGKEYKDKDSINFLIKYNELKDNHSRIFLIDEYFLKNEEEVDPSKKLFNDLKIYTNICDGIKVNGIVYSVLNLIILWNKKIDLENNYYLNSENNDNINDGVKNLVVVLDKLCEISFNDCVSLYQKYSKTIKKLKKNNYMDEFFYKINYSVMEIFYNSIKDKEFNYSKFKNILKELYQKPDIKDAKNKIDNKEKTICNYDRSISNKNIENVNKIIVLKKTLSKDLYSSEHNLDFKKGYFDENIDKIKYRKKRTRSENVNNINEMIYNSNNYKEEMNNNNDLEGNINLRKRKLPFEHSDLTDKSSEIFDNMSKTNSIIDRIEETDSDNDSENSISQENNEKNNKKNLNKKITEVQDKIYKSYTFNFKGDSKISNISVKNEKRGSCPENIEIKENNNENNDTIINEEEEEEKNNESHNYILQQLNNSDIIQSYYKAIFGKAESNTLKILFIPKQLLFFRHFGFIFRNYIFNNIKFKQLRNLFKIHFKNVNLEMSIPEEDKYELNYPIKIKNFTSNEYYRPFFKPCLGFFEDEFFLKTHTFINEKFLNNYKYKGEQFYKINFEKYLIMDKKAGNAIVCENISNKGSIYGKISFNHNFLIFVDYSNKDPRQNQDLSDKKKLFYIYSSEMADRIVNKNKSIIIYYNEIKEIFLRRFSFNYIAYEIFTKDNKSYFFNFFEKKNLKLFIDKLKEYINKLNEKNLKEENNKNLIDLDFIIDDPPNHFGKKDYKSKFIKGELNNFQYLLLVNKFGTRTFNDNSSYLIFPLLYMNASKDKMRDLSKAICLNKEELDLEKYYSNYEIMGYHFNNHYACMAYSIYYLMRILPFTNCQIKLQSGRFDAPTRMFTSLNNLLEVFSFTDENRELCPEFYYNYESFFNLNYNDFGYLNNIRKQINHFNTNQNCGVIEFVVTSKKMLNNVNISPWINIIFGSLQKSDSRESLNKFPLYSYEQYNNFDKEIKALLDKKTPINQIMKEIKGKIGLISLGLTPIQLFKQPHPVLDKFNNKNEVNSNLISEKKTKNKKEIINKKLYSFINKYFNKKYKLIVNNDNNKLKIIAYKKNKIKILNVYTDNEKQFSSTFLNDAKILKIKPFKNIIVEIFNNFYVMCRFVDKSIRIFSDKQQFSVQWTCIVTALSLINNEKNNNISEKNNKLVEFHKILLGDEEGYLSLLEITIEYNNKNKNYELVSLVSPKKFKIFYSYINSIAYIDRLNIIISSCGEGIISINNGYSFDLINLIDLGNNFSIIDFKISEYDLLYINSINKNNNEYCIKCYTLNGIHINEYNSINEIIDFYLYDSYLSVIYSNRIIQYFNGYDLSKKIKVTEYTDDTIENMKNNKIYYCISCKKIEKIMMIFENTATLFEMDFLQK